MSKQLHIAILGAGPIGMEAALYARSLDLPVTVYERGLVGEHLRRWGHVKLFTPFGRNTTPLGRRVLAKTGVVLPAEGDFQSGRDLVASYLEPLAVSSLLSDCIQTHTMVLGISRRGLLKEDALGDPRRAQKPFRILVRQFQQGGKFLEREDEADLILDCTGTYGQHRWLGDGGLPVVGELPGQQQISYQLDDILGERRAHYAGKSVLVVGSGYSAATSVCNLATLAEDDSTIWTTWIARATASQPIKRLANDPLKERDRLAARANLLATRNDANVEFHAGCTIEHIDFLGPEKGFKVTARQAGKPLAWEVDRIIGNVGYSPDTGLYRELQVQECHASLAPIGMADLLARSPSPDGSNIPACGPQALRTTEPNFYILGAKSYGRNSAFFLKSGFEQVRDVFALILGKPDLNLHGTPSGT